MVRITKCHVSAELEFVTILYQISLILIEHIINNRVTIKKLLEVYYF